MTDSPPSRSHDLPNEGIRTMSDSSPYRAAYAPRAIRPPIATNA
ncbi:hypothetical protein [Lacisediminihabitans profunda]|nr:hypothetical protein [Lacisediminihabitans profunda]